MSVLVLSADRPRSSGWHEWSLLSLLLLPLGGAFADTSRLIHIGKEKQLFLDRHIIEASVGVKAVLNPAQKAPNNPLIQKDRPWEGENIHYGTVFYDEKEEQFRMWYTSYVVYADEEGRPDGKNRRVHYAVSRDGYRWEKPSLGWVEFQGSKENNLLAPENWPNIKGGIFVDPKESDPAKRYKAMAQNPIQDTVPGRAEPRKVASWNLYYSADAFHWTPHPGNPVIRAAGPPKVHPEGESWARRTGYQGYLWGPTVSMGWDPIRGRYVMHMENCQHKRCPLEMRVIGRAESPNLIHWSQPQTIVIPDHLDPPGLQFYNMYAAPYHGLYIAMLWNYRPGDRTPADPLYIWPQFAFSRDGIRWDRRFRDPFIPLSEEPEWDSVTIYAQQPIIRGEEIYIFYNGTNLRDRFLEDIGGPGPMGAIGLAVVRLNRFVFLEDGHSDAPTGMNERALRSIRKRSKARGTESYGQVITRPFRFAGTELQLNMAPGSGPGPSEIRVELLTSDHFRIRGFTFEDSDRMSGDSLALTTTWKGRADVDSIAHSPIRLVFYLKNARLYSFHFQ